MTPIEKVCIFGSGGVGGYFGAKIAVAANSGQADGVGVDVIARGEHLNAIQKNGITVLSPQQTIQARPAMAVDDVSKLAGPDLWLLCVKSYDLASALEAMLPKVKPTTIIIPLLNGVDIYTRIRSVLNSGIVLPACVYVGVHILEPGVIQQNGGDGKILLGNDPQYPDFSSRDVEKFLRKTGINYTWSADPRPAIWEKYIFIAAYGLVTAATGLTLGETAQNPDTNRQVRSIMQEISALAQCRGIQLREDIIETAMAKAEKFPFKTKTSLQRDVELKGRKNEGDLYGGTIIKEGKDLGIATPVTRTIYARIQTKTGVQ